MKGDVNGIIDIEIFINEFVRKLKNDKILSTRLNIYIEGRLKIDIEQIYSFWNMILFAKGNFNKKPFKHTPAVVLKELHYSKLLKYFNESIDSFYVGANAELAKNRAESLAIFFLNKTNEI